MYGKRIRKLRTDKGMTQAELGKRIGVVKQTISGWENDQIDPPLASLIKLADALGVKVSYFTDDDAEKDLKFSEELQRIFTLRFETALKVHRISLEQFSDASGISIEKCRKFMDGECEPTLEELIVISHKLEVTTDYLLGQQPKISYYEQKILGPYVKLNDDNKDIIIGKAKELLLQQETGTYAEPELRKAAGK